MRIDENGLLLSQKIRDSLNLDGQDVVHGDDVTVEEDMMSNALVWLLGKIVNFLAEGDFFEFQPNCHPQIGISQDDLLTRWRQLDLELKTWLAALPQTFTASVSSHGPNGPSIASTRVWYTVPMCAATIQNYHMARILLLANRPHVSTAAGSTVTARMRSYREIWETTIYHGRQICAISLARPPDTVRTHSLQPLFVAGQCLSDDPERQVIIDLLKEIQHDLGWATDYRVRKLEDEWAEGERRMSQYRA